MTLLVIPDLKHFLKSCSTNKHMPKSDKLEDDLLIIFLNSK